MARTELGHKKAQALDYAYTVQGWIKTVNGEQVDRNTMLGKDGLAANANAKVAADVFGYSLSYFAGDYKSASSQSMVPGMLNYSQSDNLPINNPTGNLYNGNKISFNINADFKDWSSIIVNEKQITKQIKDLAKSLIDDKSLAITISGVGFGSSKDKNPNKRGMTSDQTLNARADAVRKKLINLGVDPVQITIGKPKYDNSRGVKLTINNN